LLLLHFHIYTTFMISSQLHQSIIRSMFSQINYIIILIDVLQTLKFQGSLEIQPQLDKLVKSVSTHL